MGQVVLAHLDGVELLAKAIFKAKKLERVGGKVVSSNSWTLPEEADDPYWHLTQGRVDILLGKFANQKICQAFVDQLPALKDGKHFYLVVAQARTKKPFLIDEEDLSALVNFIDDEESNLLLTKNEASPHDANKLDQLVNTKWIVYTFDRYRKPDSTDRKISGISTAVMSFKVYRKVIFDYFATEADEQLQYFGRYAYHRSRDFIMMNMQTSRFKSRDLRILMHIKDGDTFPQILIGHYFNRHGDTTFSGLLVMNRASEGDAASHIPSFYSFEQSMDRVPGPIRDFLARWENNYIELPIGIENEGDLIRLNKKIKLSSNNL